MTKRSIYWIVMALIVALGVMGCEMAFAGRDGSVAFAGTNGSAVSADTDAGADTDKGDPFAFRGGDVLRDLRLDAVSYPEYYDLRNADLDGDGVGDNKSFVTPVKLQNPFGTCWGFGAVSAAESSLIADGLADETIDLSEKHVAWFSTSHIDDPKNSQNGEGWHFNGRTDEELASSAFRYDTGGNVIYATMIFGSGMGPIVENAADPETGDSLENVLGYRGARGERVVRRTAVEYDDEGTPTSWARKPVWYSPDDDWTIPEKYRYMQSFRLKNSNILPALVTYGENGFEFHEDALNAFKQQMYEKHKAISIAFCAESYLPGQDTTGKEYMSSHWAHYVPSSEFSNHVVTIVGWDDNYPKENFLTTPPGDGAFLVKNSWGSELNDFPNNGYRHWGLLEGLDGVPYDPDATAKSDRATGYFWLSYHDVSLGDPETFEFDTTTGDDSYDIAQLDYLTTSSIDMYEGCEASKSANVFTAERTSELKEISVMTTIPGTEMSYAVYLLPDDFDDPEDGVKIAEGTAEPFEYGGYHRVSINASKVIPKGQKYSVVTSEMADNGYSYRLGSEDGSYIPLKTNLVRPENSPLYHKAIVNKGESFCRINGEWKDICDSAVQEELLGFDDYCLDNFPIKAYLKPKTVGGKAFDGYLTVDNWQEGTPGSFELFPEENKSVTAEFRGISSDMPDDWDPEITWTSSDEQVVTATPKGSDFGEGVLHGVSAGRAYVMVDAGEYGTRVISITVRKPGVLYFMFDDDDKVYTGKKFTPKVTFVSMESTDYGESAGLVEGVDYEVSYKNNVNAGKASVTVTGIGKYSGSYTEHFNIVKASNKMKAGNKTVKLRASALRKGKKVIKASKAFKVRSADGKVKYKKVKGSKNFKVVSSGKMTVKKGTKKGKYTVTVKVKAAGDKNHLSKTKTVKTTVIVR